jgi:hypothetical protein
MSRHGTWWAILGIISATLASCDETLPPRNDPENFLAASLGVMGNVVTMYAMSSDTVAPQSDGGFTLGLKNLHDEVLQGKAHVEGRIEVWVKDNPLHRAAVIADVRDLITAGVVVGDTATLGVDSTARFIRQWSRRTTERNFFWEYVRLSPKVTSNGVPYCESDSIHFVARATIHLFENTPPQKTPEIQFVLVYKIFGIQCI